MRDHTAVECVRIWLSVSVVLFHCIFFDQDEAPYAHVLPRLMHMSATMGVSIFFAFSGFFSTPSPTSTTFSLIYRRWCRSLPLLSLAMATALAMGEMRRDDQSLDWRTLWSWASGSAVLFNDEHVYTAGKWCAHMWSTHVDLHGMALVYATRHRRSGWWILACLVIRSVILLHDSCILTPSDVSCGSLHTQQHRYMFYTYVFSAVRVTPHMTGAWLATAWRRHPTLVCSSWSWWLAMAILCTTLMAAFDQDAPLPSSVLSWRDHLMLSVHVDVLVPCAVLRLTLNAGRGKGRVFNRWVRGAASVTPWLYTVHFSVLLWTRHVLEWVHRDHPFSILGMSVVAAVAAQHGWERYGAKAFRITS